VGIVVAVAAVLVVQDEVLEVQQGRADARVLELLRRQADLQRVGPGAAEVEVPAAFVGAQVVDARVVADAGVDPVVARIPLTVSLPLPPYSRSPPFPPAIAWLDPSPITMSGSAFPTPPPLPALLLSVDMTTPHSPLKRSRLEIDAFLHTFLGTINHDHVRQPPQGEVARQKKPSQISTGARARRVKATICGRARQETTKFIQM